MSFVAARLRRLVISRAGNRCEYCGLAQVGQEATFHIDHINPESVGGKTDEENLAFACVSCFSEEVSKADGR
jgi:5-methylcytosine-specific restriction endonuclease McrA